MKENFIIKEEFGEYYIHNISKYYTFNGVKINEIKMYLRSGKMKSLYGLKLDKEYSGIEIIEIDRIKQVKQLSNGLIYDSVYYAPTRVAKLEKILKERLIFSYDNV